MTCHTGYKVSKGLLPGADQDSIRNVKSTGNIVGFLYNILINPEMAVMILHKNNDITQKHDIAKTKFAPWNWIATIAFKSSCYLNSSLNENNKAA